MKTINHYLVMGLILLYPIVNRAQNVEVDVNLNIKHSVGGISDFGRERHITMHSSLYENAWEGELDKAERLFEDLDVQLGRDNGVASFLHQFSPEDENNRQHHDPDSLSVLLDFWQGEYQQRITDRGLLKYKNEQSRGAIMGTNPHPTYPTLSYFENGLNGSTWGRENGFTWIPQDIETSAAWMVQYLEEFFVENASQEGVVMPEYWEVINEPDFPLNTGQFMMSSWEDIMEYHNLVAQGIKQRLGNRAPKIGGMTWGLHDLFRGDGISRFATASYVDGFYGNTAADEVAKAYARSQVDTPLFNRPRDTPWYQWDVIWKEFIDRVGDNMDFYSVHFYDWPQYQNQGGQRRSGGHVEATLEMLEWYDVFRNGKNNRKPVIISEYGAVANSWDPMPHDTRFDWENLKPFSAMMMQFLERPDYIELSMPFHLLKAQFRDIDNNGDGIPEVVYHYKTLRDDDGDGVWEYSEFVKWYELWDDVDGTRVDTKSSDPDIQVDSYVDGNEVYLILNNLQEQNTTISLNLFEDNDNNPTSVRIKHLYLEGVRNIVLDDNTTNNIPSSVTLGAEATMILKYTLPNAVAINQTSVENKFYGEPVSNNQRVAINSGDNTFFVNNVTVPIDADKAEAMIKMTVTLFDAPQTENGFLSINKLTFNGVEVETPFDWRGETQNRSKWFGALEIPVPASLVQTNNTIVVDFQHVGEVNIVNLLTWDFSKKPGRSDGSTDPDPIAVTGVDVSPDTIILNQGQTSTINATISPANATNKNVTWSTNNAAIATIDTNGIVTANANGNAIITATTVDGGFTSSTNVIVNDNTPPTNDIIIIEAEDFVNTGGTFSDSFAGGPGLGVNRTPTNINYVNNGDWAEYTINVSTTGDYKIEYQISTPSNNAQIQLLIDGVVVATDNVTNNGQWDSYTALVSSNTIANLTSGNHTVRVLASGTNPWQWNLDKIILTRINNNNRTLSKNKDLGELSLFPNPSTGKVFIRGLNKEIEHDIRVYDIKGAKYLEEKLSHDHMVDIESLPKGAYFITINNSERKRTTLKLIKN
ncbi:carbohydrate-binding protein [Aquimarina algiphila]|uniref:carbohydrate-binding protein n=1 Tax=Aquimarina algiphila TaxID=2047982 RepID=UPI0024910428|nr:carbohydrate-binding protein [Aquimarina algiphila]